MAERTYEFEKRTLENGWVEVRIITLRPLVTPDYKLQGDEARPRIAHFFLSGAAGIADMMGVPSLSGALGDLWGLCERRFSR